MPVPLRKKRRSVLPYRVALWSVILLVLALRFVQDNPVVTDPRAESTDGVEITRESTADILVVLDYESLRESGKSFPTQDFSAAWIQIFEQELGPVAVATPQTLTESLLDAAQVLVLTASVTDSLPDPLIERVRQHALGGGTLIVERPDGRVRELFSANGRGGVRAGRAITHAEDLPEEELRRLRRMPLLTDYVGSTSPREEATTLLAIDGAPVIYSIPFGEGRAITVDFDLGRQLVALRQGRPTDDFRVRSSSPTQPPRTADLVADESLLGADTPYATLLERFVVFGVALRYTPVPGFWYFPNGASGALIFVHEDARLGDGGAWMLDYEQEHGGASTLLTTMDSGLTSEGAERIHNRGGEIGLSWRTPDPSVALYETYGLGGFHPFRQPITLADQLSDLRRTLPVSYVRTARTHDGIWEDSWEGPLSAMAGNGIRADVSYEVSTHRGYAFGTGLPSLAYGRDGIPLGLRIYPVVAPLRADTGPAIAELIEASAGGDHQLITALTRPAYFADYPDMEDFEAWLSIFDAAAEHGHPLMNVLRYDAFQRQRRAGNIRSRFSPRASLPSDARSSRTAPNHTAQQLRVVVEARERGMYLIVPAAVGNAELLTTRRGTERVGRDVVSSAVETEPIEVMGHRLHRVPLERGYNTLEFFYH